MKTILITGAGGYFGNVACRFFTQRGWRVLKGSRKPGADLAVDLDRPEKLASARLPGPIDAMLHAAAAHEVACARNPTDATVHNVAGTVAALEFATAMHIPRFVYLSTFRVFGRPRGVLDESSPPYPVDAYGLTHWQAEEAVALYTRLSRLSGFSVRPTNFYGAPETLDGFGRWTLVTFGFIREAFETGSITLRTPGLQVRNFVSVERVCEGIYNNLSREEPVPLLHIPGARAMSVLEWAKLVAWEIRRNFGHDVQMNCPGGDNSEPFFQPATRHADLLSGTEQPLSEFIVQMWRLLEGQR